MPGRSDSKFRGGAMSLRRFSRDEGGAMILFGLMLLVVMFMVGGLAVDLMRYENQRVEVQQTADRATLAAASMRQDLDPRSVVEDYFAKAGHSENLVDVDVDSMLNYRNVRADIQVTTQPYFIQMLGINQLQSTSTGAAEERITNVEIVLVLDVSGSMQVAPTRIVNLRDAAEEFVEKLLEDDEDNRVSISIVPYNGQVNLGPTLMARYNVSHSNGLSGNHCLDLPHAAYGPGPVSRTTAYPMTAYADTFSSAFSGSTPPNSWSSSNRVPNENNMWCSRDSRNYVRVHSNNKDALTTQIRNLQAVGATSIDLGLKWGLTMLDPASRPLVNDLIAANAVPAHFSGRPFDFDDPEVLKVIVLMTDGEHFDHEMLNPAYKSGTSPIYRNSSDGNFSIHHSSGAPSGTPFYVPHRSEWLAHPWGGSLVETCTGSGRNRVCTTSVSNGTAAQQSWQQVWAQLRVKWVAWQLYARPLGGSNNTNRTNVYNTWVNNFRTQVPSSDMDARLQALCNDAKSPQKDIVIFGIAFEAPAHGVNTIRNCASARRFYDVEGLEINTAFRQIRSQITSLRLTQ